MKRKILIVDDSSTARTLLRGVLSSFGEYQILQASNWSTALQLAKEKNPFLIILDYNLPEKTGCEIAQMIRQEGIKAHLVLLTANTQKFIVDEAKALGFIDIIEKPIEPELIFTLLERLK